MISYIRRAALSFVLLTSTVPAVLAEATQPPSGMAARIAMTRDLSQLPPPTVYTPGRTAPSIPYVPPPGSSPVTGFGVGGMQQPPGAPPNEPYPPGGMLR
jgi:hypothetical protein